MEIARSKNILEVRCPLHPSNESNVLHVAADAINHRACIDCVISGKVPNIAALNLKCLLQEAENQDNILSCYPPLIDSKIFQRLESIKQYSVRETIGQIEQNIDDLKRSFNEILDKFKKDQILQMEELEKQRRQVLDLYQSLCESKKLKDAVIKAAETKDESNLKEVIVGKCKEASSNTSKLQSVISQFEANQCKITAKLADQFSENLLKLNRNFSFFTPAITPLVNQHSILQQFQLIPSNLWDSAYRAVSSREDNNQLEIQCIQNSSHVLEFHSSNVLDINAFRQESAKQAPQFYIGLINNADKGKMGIINLVQYKEHSKDSNINKIIKGSGLNSPCKVTNLDKEVEMRVHLASRTIKVADFPNYNNIVELADKKLLREALMNINDLITLTDVIFSDGFDDLM